MKINDVVIDKNDGLRGKVLSISVGVSIEDHGIIEVEVIDPGKCSWVSVGDVEHYAHFNWHKTLRVCE